MAQGQGDRRAPVARYVEFDDPDVQAQFIAVAEAAYHRLVASDGFESVSQIEIRSSQAPERKGLFRRPSPVPVRVVPTTAALARVATAAVDIPDRVESLPGTCKPSRRVATVLSTVVAELVNDLIALDPVGQATHPAYRQTLRLGAELEGLGEITAKVECTDPRGCVGVRSPEHWGRRVEDVEVAEVRAVLMKLALAGGDTPSAG